MLQTNKHKMARYTNILQQKKGRKYRTQQEECVQRMQEHWTQVGRFLMSPQFVTQVGVNFLNPRWREWWRISTLLLIGRALGGSFLWFLTVMHQVVTFSNSTMSVNIILATSVQAAVSIFSYFMSIFELECVVVFLCHVSPFFYVLYVFCIRFPKLRCPFGGPWLQPCRSWCIFRWVLVGWGSIFILQVCS